MTNEDVVKNMMDDVRDSAENKEDLIENNEKVNEDSEGEPVKKFVVTNCENGNALGIVSSTEEAEECIKKLGGRYNFEWVSSNGLFLLFSASGILKRDFRLEIMLTPIGEDNQIEKIDSIFYNSY